MAFVPRLPPRDFSSVGNGPTVLPQINFVICSRSTRLLCKGLYVKYQNEVSEGPNKMTLKFQSFVLTSSRMWVLVAGKGSLHFNYVLRTLVVDCEAQSFHLACHNIVFGDVLGG